MIRKAVLPVAGLGTRFLPASKAIPKEMITVVDKPVVQYVVEEAVAAGITEIVLVNHSLKKAIEDHFDVHYELEAELEKKNKTALLEVVRGIVPAGVRVISVRQGRPLGLGHAVLCAREVIGDAPFAVLLPDVLVDAEGVTGGNDLSRMLQAFEAHQAAQIMVQQVPMSRVDQYGVVSLGGPAPAAGQSVPMTGVVEKPKPADAPSDLSVVGRYVLPARIFELLASTAPGAGNEIQLTDAIAALIQEQSVEAYRMLGATYDCGSKIGYLEATLRYGLRHPELGAPFRDLINNL
ncbi:UTP--glucose-1-phosphate uridylyltransferase GalU [Alcanivorax sp. 1008]|uniref:UTP--glucose-1-phosphate uridylyltransferase GalU n=1 Tax=Alcanivorax sp. 1008 TaxID=2816853 RepID=UPI001D684929|nr:UTP--glucose-1-phosphate uridylyltransferase GalU [Alcanivorax sp. 1008]MCC1496266.1 UTP--glucose-1-phosphate uridylyltransferase GalU [Alcanivorax sp. 1008]